MSFTKKVVIVTGASSGIGAATAILFAAEGARVALVARNEEKLRVVAEQCLARGSAPLVIIADISKDEEAKTIVNKTITHFGKLDILVNNAGVGKTKSITDEGILEVFDEIMNTNLRAAVYITSLAAPHIVKTKGNIVNVSSIASVKVLGVNCMPYSISKAGLDHFTRCAALELAAHGVRVNSVNPGPVRTDLAANSGNADNHWDIWKSSTALHRISESEEIADLIMFLASDKAKSITGSTYIADNGSVLKQIMLNLE